MGLYDKTWVEGSRDSDWSDHPFNVAMKVRDHNKKVTASIRLRRSTECNQNCVYLSRERYVEDVCLFCYDGSKFKGML